MMLACNTEGTSHVIKFHKKRKKWIISFPQQWTKPPGYGHFARGSLLKFEDTTFSGMLTKACDWIEKNITERMVGKV